MGYFPHLIVVAESATDGSQRLTGETWGRDLLALGVFDEVSF
jgi:hypothetical protein